MRFLAYLRSVAARLFHRSQIEDDMEEELRSHIQHRADDLERSGLDRAEAERRARIEFGGHQRFKEECREAIGGNFIETLINDVRFSLRVLRKSPGFTIVAVLTLALAIGANAVVFGVLNGLILRPLNVPQADSLYGTEYGDGSGWQSYPNYVDLRDRNRSFDGLAAFNFAFVGLDTGNDDPARATGFAATGNYFDVLRIQPYLGRFFHSQDEHGPNSVPYIVLSHDYWHSRFQDDRGVVGRVVRLNKHPFTIVGVAPPGFHGTLLFVHGDFFMPIVNQGQVDGGSVLNARGDNSSGRHERCRLYFFSPSGEGIRRGIDAARRLDPAGRVRQPGQPVCGSRCGPLARGCTATCAWFEPQPHPAAAIDRSRAHFPRRRHRGTSGQRRALAQAEHVEPISRDPHSFTRKSGCKSVCDRSGFGLG